ncbi:hypothetical protein [Agarivorans litoreus]|uniref:hypothetical protein n=1 Tax=Agarivorans litoreus TaxID=1510455 RepID=UPI001C7DB973|nr:hypothetical protein [Agarivorans litoreus]
MTRTIDNLSLPTELDSWSFSDLRAKSEQIKVLKSHYGIPENIDLLEKLHGLRLLHDGLRAIPKSPTSSQSHNRLEATEILLQQTLVGLRSLSIDEIDRIGNKTLIEDTVAKLLALYPLVNSAKHSFSTNKNEAGAPRDVAAWQTIGKLLQVYEETTGKIATFWVDDIRRSEAITFSIEVLSILEINHITESSVIEKVRFYVNKANKQQSETN